MRKLLDKLAPKFEKGGPLEKLYPLYEATDTILYSPGHRTHTASHVRDGIDLKRMMLTVIFALLPCVLFAAYNTGFQSATAVAAGAAPLDSIKMLIRRVLDGAQATPLPDVGAVMGSPFSTQPDLASYERDVLQAG